MNKQEIVALINAAIAGQGSQVDISGKLPAILSSIVDLIPEVGNTPLVVKSVLYYSLEEDQQRLRLVGITKDEISETLKTRAVLVHAEVDKGVEERPKFDYATGFAYVDSDGVLMIKFDDVIYTSEKIDD